MFAAELDGLVKQEQYKDYARGNGGNRPPPKQRWLVILLVLTLCTGIGIVANILAAPAQSVPGAAAQINTPTARVYYDEPESITPAVKLDP